MDFSYNPALGRILDETKQTSCASHIVRVSINGNKGIMAKNTIDIDGYTIIRRIGTGARSVIYLAKEEATKKHVAVKRAVLETPEDARIFKQIETEYKV